MTAEDLSARKAVLANLAQSRDEMRQILDPPPRIDSVGRGAAQSSASEFPRSRTMRALLSSRGLGAVGALAGGLLIARPSLALRLLRLVPVGTLGKMLMTKALSGLGKREPQ